MTQLKRFWDNGQNIEILTISVLFRCKMARERNDLHTSEKTLQYTCKPSFILDHLRKWLKTLILTYVDLLGNQKGMKIWPQGDDFHTLERPSNIHLNKFRGHTAITVWGNGPNHNFDIFFLIFGVQNTPKNIVPGPCFTHIGSHPW